MKFGDAGLRDNYSEYENLRTDLLCERLCEEEPLSELSVEYCVVADTCSFSVIQASTLQARHIHDTSYT